MRRKAGPRPFRVPEKVEQACGVRLLRTLNWRVYVIGTTRPKADSYHGTCQTPGISDVIAILPGVGVLFWEVKAKGGRVRPEQSTFGALCRECEAQGLGVYYCVGTYDALIAKLTAMGLLKADNVPHYRAEPAP